jgi:hypothetical protein
MAKTAPKGKDKPSGRTKSSDAKLSGKDELSPKELDKATGGLLPAVGPEH